MQGMENAIMQITLRSEPFIEGINADGVGGEGTLRTMWAEDERLRGKRQGGRGDYFLLSLLFLNSYLSLSSLVYLQLVCFFLKMSWIMGDTSWHQERDDSGAC